MVDEQTYNQGLFAPPLPSAFRELVPACMLLVALLMLTWGSLLAPSEFRAGVWTDEVGPSVCPGGGKWFGG